jgi:Uma2 family endonuclease
MVQAVEQQITPVRGAKLWPMSVEAYHVLGEAGVIPENTELLYGLVYTKMPKSPFHSYLVRRLLALLQKLAPAGVLVSAEQPLTLADSEPEPDLAVIRGENDAFRAAHPKSAELVIEICVSSYDYDRSKLRAYANAGVKECWLILTPSKQIEVFQNPKDGAYQTTELRGPGGTLKCQALPSLALDLQVLFAE